MYMTITNAAQFADAFKRCDRHRSWTLAGLSLLWEYVKDDDIELDVIALDCAWVEYSCIEEALEEYTCDYNAFHALHTVLKGEDDVIVVSND